MITNNSYAERNKIMQEIVIKDYYGRIQGKIEVKDNGDKTLRDFYGRILGTYQKSDDTTRDFYYRIVGHGDLLTSLLNTNN